MYEKFWDSPNFVHQYDFRITLYESRTISALLSVFVLKGNETFPKRVPLKGNVWETSGKGQLSQPERRETAEKVVNKGPLLTMFCGTPESFYCNTRNAYYTTVKVILSLQKNMSETLAV